jgi:hypothetical protein
LDGLLSQHAWRHGLGFRTVPDGQVSPGAAADLLSPSHVDDPHHHRRILGSGASARRFNRAMHRAMRVAGG